VDTASHDCTRLVSGSIDTPAARLIRQVLDQGHLDGTIRQHRGGKQRENTGEQKFP
jgi:hypothetical protein